MRRKLGAACQDLRRAVDGAGVVVEVEEWEIEDLLRRLDVHANS